MKDFAKKMSVGLLLNILLRVKSLLYFPLLVNLTTKESVGMLAYTQSVSALLLGFALLNIPDSSNRFFNLKARNNGQTLDQHTFNITITYSGCALILFTFIFFTAVNFLGEEQTLWALVYLLIISKALNKIAVFFYQIRQRVTSILIFQSGVEYFSLLAVLFLFLADRTVNYQTILAINISINMVCSVLLISKNSMFVGFVPRFDARRGAKIIKTSLILMPTIYAMVLMQNADFLMIAEILGIEELSEYSFSYSLASAVLGIQMALSMFWFSKASRMTQNERDSLFRILPTLILVVSLAVFFLYLTTIDKVIDLINVYYIDAVKPAIILSVSFVMLAAASMYSGILYAEKQERKILLATMIGLAVNISLNFVLIDRLGITGAAYASAVSYFVLLQLNMYFSRVHMPVSASAPVIYALAFSPLAIIGN